MGLSLRLANLIASYRQREPSFGLKHADGSRKALSISIWMEPLTRPARYLHNASGSCNAKHTFFFFFCTAFPLLCSLVKNYFKSFFRYNFFFVNGKSSKSFVLFSFISLELAMFCFFVNFFSPKNLFL